MFTPGEELLDLINWGVRGLIRGLKFGVGTIVQGLKFRDAKCAHLEKLKG